MILATPPSCLDPRIENMPILDLKIETALEVCLNFHQLFSSLLHMFQIAGSDHLQCSCHDPLILRVEWRQAFVGWHTLVDLWFSFKHLRLQFRRDIEVSSQVNNYIAMNKPVTFLYDFSSESAIVS